MRTEPIAETDVLFKSPESVLLIKYRHNVGSGMWCVPTILKQIDSRFLRIRRISVKSMVVRCLNTGESMQLYSESVHGIDNSRDMAIRLFYRLTGPVLRGDVNVYIQTLSDGLTVTAETSAEDPKSRYVLEDLELQIAYSTVRTFNPFAKKRAARLEVVGGSSAVVIRDIGLPVSNITAVRHGEHGQLSEFEKLSLTDAALRYRYRGDATVPRCFVFNEDDRDIDRAVFHIKPDLSWTSFTLQNDSTFTLAILLK